MSWSLSTLLVADANTALGTKAIGPVSAELNIGLRQRPVRHEQPDAENGLCEDIQDGVGDDLGIDRSPARTVGDTPNADDRLVTQVA